MLTRKIFESRISEIPFPGLWGDILQNSDGLLRPWPMFLLYRLKAVFQSSPRTKLLAASACMSTFIQSQCKTVNFN
jgi:hypothetical protein